MKKIVFLIANDFSTRFFRVEAEGDILVTSQGVVGGSYSPKKKQYPNREKAMAAGTRAIKKRITDDKYFECNGDEVSIQIDTPLGLGPPPATFFDRINLLQGKGIQFAPAGQYYYRERGSEWPNACVTKDSFNFSESIWESIKSQLYSISEITDWLDTWREDNFYGDDSEDYLRELVESVKNNRGWSLLDKDAPYMGAWKKIDYPGFEFSVHGCGLYDYFLLDKLPDWLDDLVSEGDPEARLSMFSVMLKSWLFKDLQFEIYDYTSSHNYISTEQRFAFAVVHAHNGRLGTSEVLFWNVQQESIQVYR